MEIPEIINAINLLKCPQKNSNNQVIQILEKVVETYLTKTSVNRDIQKHLDEFERDPTNEIWLQKHTLSYRDLNNSYITSNKFQNISETGGHAQSNNLCVNDVLFAIKNNSDKSILCNLSFEHRNEIRHSFTIKPHQIEWLFNGTPLICLQMGFITPILKFLIQIQKSHV